MQNAGVRIARGGEQAPYDSQDWLLNKYEPTHDDGRRRYTTTNLGTAVESVIRCGVFAHPPGEGGGRFSSPPKIC